VFDAFIKNSIVSDMSHCLTIAKHVHAMSDKDSKGCKKSFQLNKLTHRSDHIPIFHLLLKNEKLLATLWFFP